MQVHERKFVQTLYKHLRSDSPYIQVVVGPRQVGKTTGVTQLISKWQHPSLFVSADEVERATPEWVEFQWYRAANMGPKTLLVIDEIQKVKDWSRIIKVLYDKHKEENLLKIVLLGSASLKIQRGLSESLMGRYERIYVPHWSFSEANKVFSWSLDKYIKMGCYPGAAALAQEPKRWQRFIRDAIIDPVIHIDLLQIAIVYKPALFKQCFELCMSYPSQEVALLKLLGQLQEKGNVSTVKHYLELFEGAFLLKVLHKYSGSEIQKRQSSPKLLPLNNSLIQGMNGNLKRAEEPAWYGRLFESVVGQKLCTFEGKLMYWREGEEEVDFVFETDNKCYAIEVKSARKRYLKGLQKFSKKYPKSIPVVLGQDNIEAFLALEDVAGVQFL